MDWLFDAAGRQPPFRPAFQRAAIGRFAVVAIARGISAAAQSFSA